MKPILVHLHIYYVDLYEELKKCILNIVSYEFDLFITMVEEHSEIISDIKTTFPNAKIKIVENRGYDVGPFIGIINEVDLDKYSYVVKLHTKRNMKQNSLLNYFDVSGSKWRNYALDFLSSANKFKHCIEVLEKNNNIGMVSNYRLILRDEYDDKIAQQEAIKLLKKLGYKTVSYGFVAGTMFIMRSELLKPLLKLQLKIKDFVCPDSMHTSNIAHVMERLLGCLVLAEKQDISDVLTKRQYLIPFIKFLMMVKFYTFKKKISNRGILTIKICKIPVYRRKINDYD